MRTLSDSKDVVTNRRTVRKGDELDFDFDLLSKVYELNAKERATEDLNLKNATKRKKKAEKMAKLENKLTKGGRLQITKIEKKQEKELKPKKDKEEGKKEKETKLKFGGDFKNLFHRKHN